jgi:DDE superfamily endonuclease
MHEGPRGRALSRGTADPGRPRQPLDALIRRLYERFTSGEARRILGRLEFHYTPKHASWLNMVEIEIGVMVGQCLDRRIPDKAKLVNEVANWERRRNAEKARINWMFTVDRARVELRRAYPTPADQPGQAAA